MHSIALISLVTLLTFVSTAQSQPDSLWSRTFGEREVNSSRKVYQTDDGGFVIAGSTELHNRTHNLWLIFTDQNGNDAQIIEHGGDENEYCLDMIVTHNGGYAMVGKIGEYGREDAFLFLIGEDGDSLSFIRYGARGTSDIYQSLVQTKDGGFLLVGESSGDFWIVRTDEEGDSLWSNAIGGDENDQCYGVAQAEDGGFLLMGLTWSFGGQHVWLIKIDEEGNTEWDEIYGGEYLNYGKEIIALPNGRFAIVGNTRERFGGTYDDDDWLFVTESNGEIVWSKHFGGRRSEYGHCIGYIEDEGFVIGGTTSSFGGVSSNYWLLRTDMYGDSLWSKSFGGRSSEGMNDLEITSDGGYVLVGTTFSIGDGFGNGGIWLVRTGVDPLSVPNSGFPTHPESFALHPSYPNPFNSTTTINYNLSSTSKITLEVYNILGQRLQTLFEGNKHAGNHSTILTGRDKSSGLYFVKLSTNNYSYITKVLLIK
jgi:hypothetical protein